MSDEPIEEAYDAKAPRSHERDAAEEAERQRLQQEREAQAVEREEKRKDKSDADFRAVGGRRKPGSTGGRRKPKRKPRKPWTCAACEYKNSAGARSCRGCNAEMDAKLGRPKKDPQLVKIHPPRRRIERFKINRVREYGLTDLALELTEEVWDKIAARIRDLQNRSERDDDAATNG